MTSVTERATAKEAKKSAEELKKMQEARLLAKNREALKGLGVMKMLGHLLLNEWGGGEIVETVRQETDPTLTLRYEWERVFGQGPDQTVEPCLMFISVGVKGNFGPEHQVIIKGGYRLGRKAKKGDGRMTRSTFSHDTPVTPREYEEVAFFVEGYLETDTQRKGKAGLLPIPDSAIIQKDQAGVVDFKARPGPSS